MSKNRFGKFWNFGPWWPQFWPKPKNDRNDFEMIFRELSNAAFRFSLRRPGAEIMGGRSNAPPPSRRWKIQRPIRARVNEPISRKSRLKITKIPHWLNISKKVFRENKKNRFFPGWGPSLSDRSPPKTYFEKFSAKFNAAFRSVARSRNLGHSMKIRPRRDRSGWFLIEKTTILTNSCCLMFNQPSVIHIQNLNAIRPTVCEIWKTGCARAHVQMHSTSDMCKALIEWIPIHSQNLKVIRPAVCEIWKRGVHVRTCRFTPPLHCVKQIASRSLSTHQIWT